jgi:alcohol dehydrogenase
MKAFTFNPSGKLVFGAGSSKNLGAETSALGSKVLLVTGKRFLRQTGRLMDIKANLLEAGCDVIPFERVPPEPALSLVDEALDVIKEHGCNVVVAVGGGSAVDVGKAAAGLARAPGTPLEYFKGRELETKGLPFIAVPTTAGSGTEVTSNAVLIDEESRVKTSIRSSYMVPDLAIIDPELMLSLPANLTAHSGMDALCQAIEAYVSTGASPLTDVLALDSPVRLIRHLPIVYADGRNIDERTEVALGSLMGGLAFSNAGLGLAHGMAHPIGVETGLPHGLICALLLPEVIRFNIPSAVHKYARIAKSALIVKESTPDNQAAAELAAAVDALNDELGIAKHRHELRIARDIWPPMIERALKAWSTKRNPRPVVAEDVERILGEF